MKTYEQFIYEEFNRERLSKKEKRFSKISKEKNKRNGKNSKKLYFRNINFNISNKLDQGCE